MLVIRMFPRLLQFALMLAFSVPIKTVFKNSMITYSLTVVFVSSSELFQLVNGLLPLLYKSTLTTFLLTPRLLLNSPKTKFVVMTLKVSETSTLMFLTLLLSWPLKSHPTVWVVPPDSVSEIYLSLHMLKKVKLYLLQNSVNLTSITPMLMVGLLLVTYRTERSPNVVSTHFSVVTMLSVSRLPSVNHTLVSPSTTTLSLLSPSTSLILGIKKTSTSLLMMILSNNSPNPPLGVVTDICAVEPIPWKKSMLSKSSFLTLLLP